MFPEGCVDELEESDYVKGPELGPRGFAKEEEVKEFQTYGMTLCV